jgi:TldD protein
MHTCEPSGFLRQNAPRLRAAIAQLSGKYGYVSVLGTDSKGLAFSATEREKKVDDSPWSERGFVFRAQKEGRIVEYARSDLPEGDLAGFLAARLDALFAAAQGAKTYPALPDEAAKATWFPQVALDPFSADPELVLGKIDAARRVVAAASAEIVFTQARAEFMRTAKLFISKNRELEQSFIWSQGYLIAVSRRGEKTKENYESFSGLKGLELADEMLPVAPCFANETVEMLAAEKMQPGEYEVIATPDITGLIAHEAFGHGVETDMFVKGRARAKDYIGKSVASPIVNMYDGAKGVDQCGTFLFDDEGSFATRTLIIKDGILVAGLSDLQSAMALGLPATGNGRRQAFDHKAYARMTNTYFEPGKDSYEDMLASMKHGYLLEKMSSGMEDPKNWGIQLVLSLAREIRDGKLTGRVVAPVVCSGYVPQLLSDITMVSGDFELKGSGYCGKGHKEYVKVSAGGPYIKTKMRLG